MARSSESLAQGPLVTSVELALAVLDKLAILRCIVEAVVRHNVSSSATMRSDGWY